MGLSVHEKGVKGVELGKSSLLSKKTLTPPYPLPPFLKVRELGKITAFFRELSPMSKGPRKDENQRSVYFSDQTTFLIFHNER